MSKLRVIIADDEELGQKLVAKYLENAPVEICAVCSDGYETVKAVNELKPDLIFLDVP